MKTERFGAKVTPAHKLALERMAQAEDLSAAAVLRRLIRQEAERRGLWLVPDAPHPLEGTNREAARP